MAAQKRTRKNSVEGQMASLRGAAARHTPPLQLNEAEMAFFVALTDAREHDTWTAADLFLACDTAQTQAQILELRQIVRDEGLVVSDDKGGRFVHNGVAAIKALQSAVVANLRTLGLSASQRALTGAAQAGRNQAQTKAKQVIARHSADSLLAGFADDLI